MKSMNQHAIKMPAGMFYCPLSVRSIAVVPAVLICICLAMYRPFPGMEATAIPSSPASSGAKNGMVVSAHPLASQAGLDILRKGGNAVDAAVATAFVLSVVEPYHSGLGGGGFMLIRQAGTGKEVAIDYRETAPAKAGRDMFIRDGQVVDEWSTTGALAAAVPGMVAGLALAIKEYGTRPLGDVLQPAIACAENGYKVGAIYSRNARQEMSRLLLFPLTAEIFLNGQSPPDSDYVLVQRDLARTLRLISGGGPEAFYRGEFADSVAAWMAGSGGVMTREDLETYRPVLRQPVRGTYHGYEIISMAPPTSGGVHLIQMLNILEGFDLRSPGHNSAAAMHILAETMKLAFADRAHFLGDPDHTDVPVSGLISKAYADTLRRAIDRGQIHQVPGHGNPADFIPSEGTSHVSVIDREGNVVSLTQTINLGFGSAAVVPGTGVLLNNEMDDFSLQPGTPNAFGLVGGEANAVAPGKRPLSSMTPTIVLKDGKPFLILGSPGGPRIITSILQVILNVIDHGFDIREAIEAPRVHHQWIPDVLRVEDGIPEAEIAGLRRLGHEVQVQGDIGAVQGILIDPETGLYHGASDSRLDGAAIGY